MPHRFAVTFAVLVVADAVAWILTVHATLDFRAVRAGPSVMSLGDLLGWIVSIGLLVIVVLMGVSRLRRRHDARRLDSWMREVDR